MKTQVSTSAKKAAEPSVAEAKKILQQHERAKAKEREAKAKEYRAQLEGVQDQINELANAKTKELGTLAVEKKKLAQAAAKIVGKYDGKIEKLQEKMRNIRAKADAALGIKPKKILTK